MSIRAPAQLAPINGQALAVTAIDLSLGGVKLSFDKDVACKLLPSKQCTLGLIQGMEAMLEVALPDRGAEPKCLKSRCRLVDLYRRAENRFEIGCQFVESGEEQRLLISSYLVQMR